MQRLPTDSQDPLAAPGGRTAIIAFIPGDVPETSKGMPMTSKRLLQPMIGVAALAAVALGGSALAEAATTANTPASVTAAVPPSGARTAPLTSLGGGSPPASSRVRNGRRPDRDLTDHERYVRHHQRLASIA